MDEDEKMKVWKDEAAMNGYIIKDVVKVKDLKKLVEEIDVVRYEEHAEEEYRAHLKKFFKGDEC